MHERKVAICFPDLEEVASVPLHNAAVTPFTVYQHYKRHYCRAIEHFCFLLEPLRFKLFEYKSIYYFVKQSLIQLYSIGP